MKQNVTQIIDTIAQHWATQDILPSVREHQARVAGIVCVLRDHWQGSATLDNQNINWNHAILAALCHDLGNIIKAKLDSPFSQQLLGPLECERLAYWSEVKEKLRTQYGDDEYAATRGILASIVHDTRARARLVEIIEASPYKQNREIAKSSDWETVVVGYADRRVGPYGVLTLGERTAEGAARYKINPNPLSNALDAAAQEIESRVQEHLAIPVASITDELVDPYVQRFLARN